jgi:pyruvate dehydrogenase E2 component (dihydrolipoamide acetyltransferase)
MNMDTSSPAPSRRLHRVIASPRARRALNQLGLDPKTLRGSGPNGRLVLADVQTAARSAPGGGISIMRRAIAEKTALSFSTAPHFYLRAEVDATALLDRRQQLLDRIERQADVRLTLSDFLLRAVALALRECPWANCIWQNNTVVRLPSIDVGLVVGLPDGLLIPLLRQADTLDLPSLARQRAALVAAARAGKLPADATRGGATSVSNLGTSRVDEFAAILAPPQSSVLAVGRAAPRPFVVDGKLAVRTTLNLCLSVDHRVLDGGPAGEFLGRIVQFVEQPDALN